MITYEGGKMCAGEEEKMENSGFGVGFEGGRLLNDLS